jgi:O-antigen/teichoic acid export membrane protein
LGWGIYGFALAGVPSVILSPIVTFWICRRNHYYPSNGFWGRPNWAYFRQVFLFGKDVLWITLGSQMVNASQIMILSRVAGLSSAATFAVGTKLFTMGQLLIGKVIDSSGPALTELFVRREISRFNLRFAHVICTTAFASTIGATSLMTANSTFVSFWTSSSVRWSPTYDAILAGLLLAAPITRCLILSFGLMQGYQPVRHIYFVEGCVFITVAIPSAAYFGIIGILVLSLIVHLAVTATMSLFAYGKALGLSKILIRPLVASTTITAFAFVICFLLKTDVSPLTTGIWKAAGTISLVAILGWFFILPNTLRTELLARIPNNRNRTKAR